MPQSESQPIEAHNPGVEETPESRLACVVEKDPKREQLIGCVDDRPTDRQLEKILLGVPGGLAGFALTDYMVKGVNPNQNKKPREIIDSFINNFQRPLSGNGIEVGLHNDDSGQERWMGCGFLAKLEKILTKYFEDNNSQIDPKSLFDLSVYDPSWTVKNFTSSTEGSRQGVSLITRTGQHMSKKGLIIDDSSLCADRDLMQKHDDYYYVLDLASVLDIYRDVLGYDEQELIGAKKILIGLFRATLRVLSEDSIGDEDIVDVSGGQYEFEPADQ
ncbi:hypothetical protein KA531_00180 [Candidatus Saccharibacteria bacterium]|nr:hypothetical protein [Candidatus Saccharibacteria bacterium]